MSHSASIPCPQNPSLHRRSFGRAMQWDADLPRDLVEQMWCDPHSLLIAGQTLQDKPRCTVVRIDHPQGPFLFKYHNWGSAYRTLRKSLRRSIAKKNWLDSRHLHASGIPTPLSRAYLERRLGPLDTSSYLLTDYISGATLYRFMRFNQPSEETVLHLARQVAEIWQRLDDLHISHNDLKTENLLIDPTGRVWLIDLEQMHRHRHSKQVRRRQIEDACRLFHPRNWRTNPAAAEIFRQQILQTPAGAASAHGPKKIAHPLCQPLPAGNRPSHLVTVFIPCRNDAHLISGCLESLRDIADEILVADAGSTDNTLEIVRKLGGCRILQRPCNDEAKFENWAAQHARHPWILRVLPAERLSPELAKETQVLLAEEPVEDGFYVTRQYSFGEKPMRYGLFRRDSSLRLYRRGAGHHEMRNGRLEVIIPSGKTSRMSSKLLLSQSSWNIGQYLPEIPHPAYRGAIRTISEQFRSKRPAALGYSLWHFFRSYLLGFGWLAGRDGLHACLWSAKFAHQRGNK